MHIHIASFDDRNTETNETTWEKPAESSADPSPSTYAKHFIFFSLLLLQSYMHMPGFMDGMKFRI